MYYIIMMKKYKLQSIEFISRNNLKFYIFVDFNVIFLVNVLCSLLVY